MLPTPPHRNSPLLIGALLSTGTGCHLVSSDAHAIPAHRLPPGLFDCLREPTRVLILRQLPDGQQLTIRCDLDRAIHDPKERIRILPDDVVILQFKPTASIFYGAFNYVSGNAIVQAFSRSIINN